MMYYSTKNECWIWGTNRSKIITDKRSRRSVARSLKGRLEKWSRFGPTAAAAAAVVVVVVVVVHDGSDGWTSSAHVCCNYTQYFCISYNKLQAPVVMQSKTKLMFRCRPMWCITLYDYRERYDHEGNESVSATTATTTSTTLPIIKILNFFASSNETRHHEWNHCTVQSEVISSQLLRS